MNINSLGILLLQIVILALGLILFVLIAVLTIECSAAILPRFKSRNVSGVSPKLTVLVPAHNEELVIGTTLETLIPQITSRDQIIVIADNCSDNTAAIARMYGVQVVERIDSEKKGKGFALEYGLKLIAQAPPDVVIFVDADSIVEQGCIEKIAKLAHTSGKPVQATYLMAQPTNPQPNDSVSALAFMVKNLVRPLGLAHLGLPCLLTGTGMAFPWKVISQASLGSSNIVEDMQLAVDLAIAGYAPILCADAKIVGILPKKKTAAKTQRTRWEHGHLQTLTTQVPKLLKAFVEQKRFELLTLALELSVPPLTLLVMLWAVVTLISVFVGLISASWWPTAFLGIQGLLILISIVGAWTKFGRKDIPGSTLLSVPFYMLWKIPLYLTFLMQRQTQWVRTERDAEA